MVDIRKRAVLKGLAATALGGLSGCCTTADVIDEKSGTRKSNKFLAMPNELKKAGSYYPAIDSHAHFFNATDMQAGGYLTGPIANELGISSELVKQIGNAVANITKYVAPSARDEWLYLDELDSQLISKSFKAKQDKLDQDLDRQNKKSAEALFSELDKNDKFKRAFRQEIDKTGFYPKSKPREFSQEFLYESFSDDYQDITLKKAFSDKQFNIDPRKLKALFGFVGRMLNYRILNIHAYRKAYFFNSPDIKTIAACDALVDFDNWVGDCELAYSLMRDQVLLHQRLARVTDNYVFPVVAYNPWSAIKDEYRYLDLIEDAIKHRGFKGVKLYPTIGYFPTDNNEPGRYPLDKKHPDLKKLDESLHKLYEITKSYDVPVMAHGNHSMGRDDAHKMMGGPDAWGRLFKKPGYDQFKTNIGHFGGTRPDEHGHAWSEVIVELMKKNRNLYADVSYWEELMKPDYAPNLIALMNKDLGAGQKASQRIMFGTDWFMLNMEPDWKQYSKSIYANLRQHIQDESVLKAFFYDNARRFYKLDV